MATHNEHQQAAGSRHIRAIKDPSAFADLLAEALTMISFLVIAATITAIYSGYIWVALDALQAHVPLGMSYLPYEQCAGLGLLFAFIANTFTGVVDRCVNRILANLVEGFLGLDFSEALKRRYSRRQRRRRAAVAHLRNVLRSRSTRAR